MKYVYLDNLRGFSDTFVPLADVNFLVGENSTGKTSFMNVLRMLSASWLLTGQEAYGDEIQLGGFAELVSAHSKDHSYFRLGFIADAPFRDKKKHNTEDHPKETRTRAFAVLLTYKNVDGLSRLACFTCTMLNHQITLLFDEETIHYRVDSAPESESAEKIKPHFQNLIEHHKNINKHSCKILERNIAAEQGHYPLMYLIMQAYQKAKDEKTPFGLSMPPMAPDNVVRICRDDKEKRSRRR